MQYALLIYAQEAAPGPDEGNTALSELMARHMAFTRELGPARLGGAGLKSTANATTVRTQGGAKTVHDGPFAETKEQLGGLYLIDAPDLDAAIATARKVPLPGNDGSIEIRPLLIEVH
jgi:hypothetical protein